MNIKVIAQGAMNFCVKRCSGSFLYRRQWLNKTQWMRREQLERIQLQCMRKLLIHAFNTVPYYHELMVRIKFNPDIKCLSEIEALPILTKKDVLEAKDEIFSKKYLKLLNSKKRTGGTTGTPLRIQRNLFSLGIEHAFIHRQLDWAGISLSDRTAWLVAGRRLGNPNAPGILYAYDPFMRELTLSSYHLTPETANQYIRAMQRYKVKALVGLPSAIYYLAQICSDKKIPIKLNAVLTTSELITENMKAAISQVFDCKVFDFYGAAERVCYIHTCDNGSYHIVPEYGYTEFLLDQEDHKKTVVATGFWNHAMPLIRYNTGDKVDIEETQCECKRVFPTVKSIAGRTADVIKTPSGKVIGPTIIARVVKEANNIYESQAIQDRIDHLCIYYVPGINFTEKDLLGMKKKLNYYLPDELKIDLISVSRIPKTETGKLQLIISKL